MVPAECFVRYEDSYVVVVLDPGLDRRWGSPYHVVWVNPEVDPQTDEPIILQPSEEHASSPINRSKLEALLTLTPHTPLYAFLNARGIPSTYHGEIDPSGRLHLTKMG